jgi:hypothetical protein
MANERHELYQSWRCKDNKCEENAGMSHDASHELGMERRVVEMLRPKTRQSCLLRMDRHGCLLVSRTPTPPPGQRYGYDRRRSSAQRCGSCCQQRGTRSCFDVCGDFRLCERALARRCLRTHSLSQHRPRLQCQRHGTEDRDSREATAAKMH